MQAQFREQRPADFVASTRVLEDFVGILELYVVPPSFTRQRAEQRLADALEARHGARLLGRPRVPLCFRSDRAGTATTFYNGG
jgi:hypothetical protein